MIGPWQCWVCQWKNPFMRPQLNGVLGSGKWASRGRRCSGVSCASLFRLSSAPSPSHCEWVKYLRSRPHCLLHYSPETRIKRALSSVGEKAELVKCLLCRQEYLSFEILSTYPKAAWWHVSVTPMLESCAGGRQVMQDRWIMGAHWLASLAKWMSSRFSKRLCLKNEGDVNNEHINMERKSLTLNSTLDKELQQLRNV